ncbi:hypothetical protein ACTFIZ_009891 [Dictyostelium cf. discoideum]
MELKYLILLLSIISVVKSDFINWIGSNSIYVDPRSWSTNTVPTENDEAVIQNNYVELNDQIDFYLPHSLQVSDNSIFNIINSNLLMADNSTFSLISSLSAFENVEFVGDSQGSNIAIVLENSQVGADGSIKITNIDNFEIKDTLLAGYSQNYENELIASNSNILITGISLVVYPIITYNSSLTYKGYTPQDYSTDQIIINYISNELIIDQSNFISKNTFVLNNGSSPVLIKGSSFVSIGPETTTFLGSFEPTLKVDEVSLVSVESSHLCGIGAEITGGSGISFTDSVFCFNSSIHSFAPTTGINFKGGLFLMGSSDGKGLETTNIHLYDNAVLSFDNGNITLGMIEIQNAKLNFTGIPENEIIVQTNSFVLGLGQLDLNSIASGQPVRIKSHLPLLFGYGTTVVGNGTLESSSIINYGTLGSSNSISTININGTLLQDDENESKIIIFINEPSDFSTINVSDELNINNSTLILYVNSSLLNIDNEFNIINFNSFAINSTLFRVIHVYSVGPSNETEITTGYQVVYTENNVKFIISGPSSSSESSSSNSTSSESSSIGSSSESSSSNSTSSESSSIGSSSESSSSNSTSESSSSNSTSESSSIGSSSESSSSNSTSESSSIGSSSESSSNSTSSESSGSSTDSSNGCNGSSSDWSSSDWSSSDWSSSESSNSGSDSDSWESSSSDDSQVVCSFNPIKGILEITNQGSEKIECHGQGDTYCANPFFECGTKNGEQSVTCSAWRKITCIGRHISCDIGKIMNCNTNLPNLSSGQISTTTSFVSSTSSLSSSSTTFTSTSTSSPTSSASALTTFSSSSGFSTTTLTPTPSKTNECDNVNENSYCFNGKVYCKVPFTGPECNIVNVETTPTPNPSTIQQTSQPTTQLPSENIEKTTSSSSKIIINTLTVSLILLLVSFF